MSDEQAPSTGPPVLHALAVGRLLYDQEADGFVGELIADNLNNQANNEQSINPKKTRQHLKAILTKGSAKLVPNKRLRLRNDADGFDVHLFCVNMPPEQSNHDEASCRAVFFACTVPEFNKYFSISQVFRDFTHAMDQSINHDQFEQLSTRQLAPNFTSVFAGVQKQYGRSPLTDALAKVESVKSIMQTNVARALNSVEHLEDMEEQSERFQEQSKTFQKRAVEQKKKARKSFYVLTCLIIVFFIVIIVYFAVPWSSTGSDDPKPQLSSTGVSGP